MHVNAPGRSDVPAALVERALREVLRREGVPRAELSVTFLDDLEMARLHDRHLGASGPTDVLAFALHDDGEPPLGDIYVGRDQALRQAREAGAAAGEEMARLAVHGALHVLGRDHPADAAREQCEMFRIQEDVLRRVLAEPRAAPAPALAP